MISNPFFLLSILISSLLAFLTIAFAVEILIKITKTKNHRTRATLRLLPFISLFIDLLFNQYSVTSWINPLSCGGCIQKLLLETFFPWLKIYLLQNQISLITYLGFTLKHLFFSAVFVAFGTVSTFFVLRKFIQALFSIHSLRSITKRALICRRPLSSTLLIQSLKKNKARIFLSSEIEVPLTVHPNIIIVPEVTNKLLSSQEFDAVIAHEWEHIKHLDSLTRLLYRLTASLFWWIPTSSWIKKTEQEQEMSCDQNIAKYGINTNAIASALFKIAKQRKMHPTACYFAGPENTTLTRIQNLLCLSKQKPASIFGISFFAILLGGSVLLLCLLYL